MGGGEGGGVGQSGIKYKPEFKFWVLPVCHCRRNPSSSSLEPNSLAYLRHLRTEVMSEPVCACL